MVEENCFPIVFLRAKTRLIKLIYINFIFFFRLIPIGLFLNGCAYAVTAVGATVLSETWFPPSQRATATVIYIISAAAGGALVFIVGKSQNSLIK